MMKKLLTVSVLLGFALIVVLNSCEKEEPEGTESLTGNVYYANTTIPVSGVLLTIDGKTATTGSDGRYSITRIRNGNQTLTAAKDGFDNYSVSLQISTGSNQHNVEMTSYQYIFNLKGIVTSIKQKEGTTSPLAFCQVVVLNPDGTESNLKSQTSSSGYYQITVPQGNRTVRFIADHHETVELNIFMANSDYQLDMEIPRILIGQKYGGGVIAYVLQPGDPGYIQGQIKGLIVPPSDQGSAPWGCSGTSIGTGIVIGTGASNTAKIIAGCSQAGIAARLCDEFVLGGYSDWYLPSKDELNKLYLNRAAIGGFASDSYWSSSEFYSTTAWSLFFSHDSQNYTIIKSHTYRVRAVRTF